jgi:hypothetical protein
MRACCFARLGDGRFLLFEGLGARFCCTDVGFEALRAAFDKDSPAILAAFPSAIGSAIPRAIRSAN